MSTENIDIFSPKSFVMESLYEYNDMGKIVWTSYNAKKVLDSSDFLYRYPNIQDYIPRVIRTQHLKILENSFAEADINSTNRLIPTHMYDGNDNLFSCDLFNTLSFTSGNITVYSYIKQHNKTTLAIISPQGNLDSGGQNIKEYFEINPDLISHNTHMPIALCLPQLIPYFLPYIYDKHNFEIEVG